MDLTSEDISVLIEALNAWKTKGLSSLILGSVLTGITGRSREETDRKVEEQVKKYDEDVRTRVERCILLQAKLITLRDRLDIERVTRDSGAGS